MISEPLRERIRRQGIAFLLLWAADLLLFGLYYLVALRAVSRPGSGAGTGSEVIGAALTLLAIASLGAGLSQKWRAFSLRRAQAILAREPAPLRSEGLSADEDRLLRLARLVLPRYAAGLLLINACALIGMAFSIVERNLGVLPPFLFGACVAWALSFPRLETFIDDVATDWRPATPPENP